MFQMTNELKPDESAPTDEQIESHEAKLADAQNEQKKLFLIIFQVPFLICYGSICLQYTQRYMYLVYTLTAPCLFIDCFEGMLT